MNDAPNNLPLVTVITPAYNREDLLEETIESVLDQNYPNLEFIILDDGSKDGTLDVIKRYANKVRYVTHQNMGETKTVNKGFSIANGDIIGVVNSDDPLLPNAINTIIQYFLSNPDVLVIYPDWKMIDGSGKCLNIIQTYEYDYLDMVRWHHCMPGPGTFFRREVIETLRGRDEQFRYVGDFDFWLRAGLLGKFMRLPDVLATFRVHSGSASVSSTGHDMAEEHIRLINKIFSITTLPREVQEKRREAYSSAYYIAGAVSVNRLEKVKYYLQALLFKPSLYFGEYRSRLFPMFLALWPRG